MTIRIEDVATVTRPPEEPPYSPHGYLIAPDGTTYTLHYQWWHGALLALLYPDQAKEAGYEMPNDRQDVNVYEFQRFELDNHELFPVLRICPGRFIGPMSVDRGCDPTTPEQVAAMRLIIEALGMNGEDEVATDHRDMKVREMWEYLIEDRDVWGRDKRTVRKHRLIKNGEDERKVMDELQEAEVAETMAKNPDAYKLNPPEDDGTGIQSFERAAGIFKKHMGRNDE